MEDDHTKVSISKTDITDGKEIEAGEAADPGSGRGSGRVLDHRRRTPD